MNQIQSKNIEMSYTPLKNSPAITKKITEKITRLLQTKPDTEKTILAFLDLLSEKDNIEKKLAAPDSKTTSHAPSWIPILGRTAAGILHFWHQTILPSPKQASLQLEKLIQKYTKKPILHSVTAVITSNFKIKPLFTQPPDTTVNIIYIRQSSTQCTDCHISQFIESDQIRSTFPDAFALQIDGDSMAPKINHGDFVILSSSVRASQGQAAVVQLRDHIGLTCKIIRTANKYLHLIPINEKYQIKTVPSGDLLWALAVLCCVKTKMPPQKNGS